MNERLHEALEICLRALEQGYEIDSALALYPELQAELRPLLDAFARARQLAAGHPPAAVQARGRARLLQHAARLRERAGPHWPSFVPGLRRTALVLGLAAVFFLSSTGLVSASSGALPGDQLYRVKRTWEDLRLWMIFDPRGRELLENEYEQERVDEINELLAAHQAAMISFSGIVTRQAGSQWVVSGIPVLISSGTRLPAEPVSAGAPVLVSGWTQADGLVAAESITFLAPGAPLPPLEPSEDGTSPGEAGPEGTSGEEHESASSSPAAEEGGPQEVFEFRGVVQGIRPDGELTINGQTVRVAADAEVAGEARVGALVRFEGYYGLDGVFVATKIEFGSAGGGSSGSGGDGEDSGGSSSSSSSSSSSGSGGGDDGGD
jgi:hypothetical protein